MRSADTTVAVVLPLRGPTELALAAARSLLDQTLEAWELILAGPGAEEVFAAIGGRDPRVRPVPAGRAAGSRAACLNRALAASRSPAVAFLEADERAHPDRLAAQWAFLERHPEYGLVAGGLDLLDRWGKLERRLGPRVSPDTLLALLLHENVLLFGTVMARRACLDRLGGFDEHLSAGTEHDCWLRAGLAGPLAALPEVVGQRFVQGRTAPGARAGSAAACPDPQRERYLERLLTEHPRGASILEEAASRFPEDEVLWACHSRRGGRSASAPGSGTGATSLLYLRCLRHRLEGPEPLNRLAGHYRARGNPLLAHLCDLRSLGIEPHQEAVFEQAYRAWSDGVTTPRGRNMGPGTGDLPAVADASGAAQTAPSEAAEGRCAVSVVMPTHNRARWLRESARSVLDQTFRDFELVIVDDGSTDETEAVVRSLGAPQVRYIRSEHRGLAAALNTGLEQARGRYLAYLDDDDVYYPDHLARLVQVLETSGAPMAYAKSRCVFGQHDGERFRPDLCFGTNTADYDYDLLHYGCIIGTLNVLHRRDCLLEVGGFDERLPRCMDWDLWVRMSERFRIVHLEAYTGEYRHHRGNTNAANLAEGAALTELLRDYFTSCRGVASLLRAAHLLGRAAARERARKALESVPLALREDLYRQLLTILPEIPGGSGLIERLASHRPRWYLRFLLARLRERRWDALRQVPLKLYPLVAEQGARGGGARAARLAGRFRPRAR